MKSKKDSGTVLKIASWLVFLVICTITLLYTMATPDGASITYVSNTTKSAISPGSRTDDKGYIHTIILTTTQQNNKWKAYVGNVSGTLVLRDADDYSIYEWPTGGSPSGEVYITRNSTIDWSTIQCANETDILNEQSSLGHSASATDNINNTFSQTIHKSFYVGTTLISNSTCRALATWINNTEQTLSENALFQEVLLMDANSRIIYTALIDQDTSSYRNDSAIENRTYDFQAIVPDYTTASTSTYYFYVEIDG